MASRSARAQLAGVGGAEGEAELLQAGAEHVLGIVQHGEAAFQARAPEVGPARGRAAGALRL